MTTKAAGDYIRRVANDASGPESDPLKAAVELYDRKLWHQLTELCLKLSVTTLSTDPKLYTDFIIHFQKKINRVSLVKILNNLVNHAFHKDQPIEALEFLSTSKDSSILEVLDTSPNAKVVFHSLQARLYLQGKQAEDAKNQLELAKELVDNTYDLEAFTHAYFYKATAEYHKVMGPAADFYKYALLFFAYTSPESLSADEKKEWAFDIAIAALVGEDIYTFEEVLRHALVQELKQGEHKWLIELMQVMNKGDVEGYTEICNRYSKQMNRVGALVAKAKFLKQKVTILALVDMAEQAKGVIHFEEIEKRCKIPRNEVEYLIMRSLSLGLIKGKIDGVDKVLEVTTVRPKLLDRQHCKEMAQKLAVWRKNVESVSGFMEKESQPLSTS